MKKIPLAIILVLFAICLLPSKSWSQTLIEKDPYPKKITVSGSAEMEVAPDEIYVNIELREYQKKGEEKKDIETLKTQFLSYCNQAGIPDSNISIVSFTGVNNYYRLKKNKKKPDLLAGITYQVKIKSSTALDVLIENLDDEATYDFDIVRTSHSKMPEFRKHLKILAIKAAKDKGIYLTDAIGEQLGDAITVNEPGENNYSDNNNVRSNVYNMRSQAIVSTPTESTTDIAFKKIKLRFEVTVVFALK
jgi:uncharacterized protein YggE